MNRLVVVALLVGGAAWAQKPSPKAESDPWAGRKDLFVAPRLTPNIKVALGPIQRFTLPNGLQVLVIARPQIPVVDTMLAVEVGGNADPRQQAGLAQFVASMLHKGTEKRTADQIAELTDFAGARFNASADDDYTAIACHARGKDLALCLDLTNDVVAHPVFPESEMKEVHDQLEASVDGIKDSPEGLAAQHAENVYFGDDDPRGRTMSKRSLAAIDRQSLVDFHHSWYAPNHSLLAVAGDVDPRTIKATLLKAFAGWKKHEVPQSIELPPTAVRPLRVRLVDKPDATQAAITVMGPGIAHRAPDYYATRLMSWALGAGGFSSRLMKVIRSEGGKTYGAHLGYSFGRWQGPWSASTFTRTSEAAATLKLMMETIAGMKKGGPTDEELDAAKGNTVGGYGLKLETAADLAHALLSAKLDRMDDQAVEEFPQRMNAVTVQAAAAAAAAHLDATTLVVVGPAKEVRPQLEKAGFRVDEAVRFDESPSPSERALEAAAHLKAGEMTPAEAQAGQKLVALALAAKGGDLSQVKDISMAGKGTMTMGGKAMEIVVEEFQVPGKAARQDISFGPMKMQQVIADGKAWMKQGDKVMELPAPAAVEMQKGLLRDPNFILLYAHAGKLKARGLPPVSDGGVKYDALELIAPDGDKTRVLFDQKTHLIARFDFQEADKATREAFGDYRKEGGISVPHKVEQQGEGNKMEITYDKVTINPNLPASTFRP